MPHSSRMDPSHNPLQQQQHQGLHSNANMGGPGGPMHSRNPSQNPRMHTDSFGLGGAGGPGDIPEPAIDVRITRVFDFVSLYSSWFILARYLFVTSQSECLDIPNPVLFSSYSQS